MRSQIPLAFAAFTCLGLAPVVARGQEAAATTAVAPVKRLPVYAHIMLFGGAMLEDRDHRITTGPSRTLEGFGGAASIGGTIDDHHRFGGRLQLFMRPTRKVARQSPPPDPSAPATPWGAVISGYLGPEYMYRTALGFYAAGSVGIGFALSAIDDDGCGETTTTCTADQRRRGGDNVQHASIAAGGIASLGYEWRPLPLLAVNAEIFGGLSRGVDDDEASLTNGTYGLALGLGF